jgi:serine/threonine protein kinase/Tol biopolymer transport system component
MSLEQGNLLHNRYRIVDILGQGGMGSVYRAIDENLGVEVAVKENLFTTDEYARQFRLEAVILAGLRQQNMPRVTDHFVIGAEGQYLVMDYIEGDDLRQRMERIGTISDEEAIIIGAAICDALGYLHTRKPPILHRDLKPGNVKLSPDGQVYLVDFGLAKIVRGGQQTTTGARAMTPGYSPPEQYGTARTDPRSDIYSLGATLYAALTGIIPEDGLSRVMDNIGLTPTRKRNPRVSRKLAAAIEKAMEAFPDDRFQNTEEFKQALLSAGSKTQRLNDYSLPGAPDNPDGGVEIKYSEDMSPPSAGGRSGASKVKSRARRRRRNISGCLLFILLILVSLAATGMFFYSVPALIPPDVARILPAGILPAATATPTPDTPTPDLSALPEVTPAAIAGVTVTEAGLNQTPSATYTPTPRSTATPTASSTPTPTTTPLGAAGLIAFASNRGGTPQIYLMNFDGSSQHPITNEADGACQPAWSPDGRRLAFVSPCLRRSAQDTYDGTSIYIINADGTGRTALLASAHGDFDPAWSPDGSQIAFTSLRDGYQQIYTIDLATSDITRITDTPSDVATRQPAWSPDGLKIAYAVRRVGILQIWLVAKNGVNPVQIVRNGSLYNDFMPSFGPDSDLIFYSETTTDFLAPPWLMSVEPEGTDRGIRSQAQPPVVDVQVSPDGFWLVFESSDGTNTDIYRTTITGGNRTRLTSDLSQDFDPAWQRMGQ